MKERVCPCKRCDMKLIVVAHARNHANQIGLTHWLAHLPAIFGLLEFSESFKNEQISILKSRL